MIRQPPHGLLLATLAGLAAALFAASLATGYAPLDLGAGIADSLGGRDTLPALVVVEIRLPRALLGLLVGFTLGAAGAAMQGLLRNPLAEPGVIGVSGAAALGSVAAFYSGLAGAFALALPLGGIAGAILAIVLLQAIAGTRAGAGAGNWTLILAGIAINAFAGALTALALNLSPSPYAAMEIVFWLMGSLADRGLDHVALVLAPMILGWALLLGGGRGLDALTLGEDTARSMGVDVDGLRRRLVLGTALAVGAAVSVSGVIGFVGLVVPHLLRPLVGHRPGRLLLASGFGGAALTLAADLAVRLIDTRPEMQLGVVTALVGAPFLLHLVLSARRGTA